VLHNGLRGNCDACTLLALCASAYEPTKLQWMNYNTAIVSPAQNEHIGGIGDDDDGEPSIVTAT
jgi:hypothetical protein